MTNEETIRWPACEGVTPMIFLPFPDLAIKGAEFYRNEAAKAGRTLAPGRSIGVARFAYVTSSREQALETARNRSIVLYRQFHDEFHPQIPTTVEPLIEANGMLVGFLPFDEVNRQAEIFGTEITPELPG